jgi:hypothetical protein
MGSLRTRSVTLGTSLVLLYPAIAPAQNLAAATAGTRVPGLVEKVPARASSELAGLVTDSAGQPLAGVVVSALGSTSVYAVSDREGRFVFRNVPLGSYLVRAHLQGYAPARGRIVQVGVASNGPVSITLYKGTSEEPPPVLAAGGPVAPVGAGLARDKDDDKDDKDAKADKADKDEQDKDDHDEVAWRMRHARRSVLKDAVERAGGLEPAEDLDAFASAAHFATSFLSALPVDGQLDLLTAASFERPQDLFTETRMPRGVALLSLGAPSPGGEWRMKGTVTQGDLSSFIVSGAFVRDASATHAYEAGASYAMQRYMGGNAEALAAMRDGSRNVGILFAHDDWKISPRVRLGYGARYADYGYLEQNRTFSPRISLELQPLSSDEGLRVRLAVMRTETAPGAVEFEPPAAVYLPPERTFSSFSDRALVPERVDHAEVGVRRAFGAAVIAARVFQQATTDQVVGMFGASANGTASTGHYQLGSVGNVDARGWGVSVETPLGGRTRATVDYRQANAMWTRGFAPERAVPLSIYRVADRVQNLTASVQSVLPMVDTRLLVVYNLNTADALADESSTLVGPGRFEIQVNQALPFLAFTNARWEALVAVRNMFYDAVDGASIYDEMLVVRPPTRVLGGVTVKF